MVDWSSVLDGLRLISQWQILAIIVIGMLTGLLLGVIPGMTGGIGIAVMLPITFQMDPLSALVLLTAVYTGGLTGGGITAILIGTPGAPAAVATTFDGYPMTKKGYQNEALGLQITSSALGGLFSYVFLLFFIRPMVQVALKFGPSEMIALTVFVMFTIGALGATSFSRALFSGIFGLLVGTVGTCEATGIVRGSMGFDGLEDGIPTIICIVGMFAVSEMMELVTRDFVIEVGATSHDVKRLLHGARTTLRNKKTVVRSAIIGTLIGVLPAAGASIASLFSYSQAKRSSKAPEKFGTGEPIGLIAAETANNASEGGAMSTLLALGIPGSASTALLMGAFMLHGLVPGARLLVDYAPLVYGLILANIFQMILLGAIALVVAFYLSRVIFIPTRILVPSLMVVMSMGAYSVRNLFFDVHLFFFFGILGWFFRRYNFSLVSFLVGFILARDLDMEVYQYAALFGSDLSVLVKRPITLTLMALSLLTLAYQIYRYFQDGRR